MDDANHKTLDPERRMSLRTTRTLSLQPDGGQIGEGVDDADEYVLTLAGMVSDGFRPGDLQLELQPPAQVQSQFQRQPTTVNMSFVPSESACSARQLSTDTSPAAAFAGGASSSLSPRLNRSSISKTLSERGSFSLRHDGPMGHVLTARPSLSTASSASNYAAAHVISDGLYLGATGPSDPNQTHTQDSRPARTPSMASTSTAIAPRPLSEYNGPTGPSHPYSIYPQNPLEDTTPQPAVPDIPLGFTSGADPYQRRIGPDGEDVADMIGPDGHTEELPPYTRYPDEVYALKIRDTESNARPLENTEGGASTAVAVLADILPSRTISGAGGIGLAARNPEFDSRSDDGVAIPHSRHSTQSFTTDSHHDINMAGATIIEKPQLTKYQRFAKKKACDVVPYWAIGLTGISILLVIIITATVAILFSHRRGTLHKPSSTDNQDSMPTAAITYDATPIPTPSDLPALPQGNFGLHLNLNQAPNTCFKDTAQTSAWSCNIIFPEQMASRLSITRIAPESGDDGTYEVMMLVNSSLIDDKFAARTLSYGSSAPVIQPSMDLELVNDTYDLSRGPAWFRMLPYNKTVVVKEGLFSASTSSVARRKEKDFHPGFVPKAGNFQRKGVAQAGEKPWICTWPNTFVEIFIYALQNSSSASLTSAPISTAPPTASAPASDEIAASTNVTEVIPMDHLTIYPRAVKVKERRVGKAPSPYCVQVEVQADNTATPVLDANGNQIMIEILEQPDAHETRERGGEEGSSVAPSGADGDMSNCGCMWFSS